MPELNAIVRVGAYPITYDSQPDSDLILFSETEFDTSNTKEFELQIKRSA